MLRSPSLLHPHTRCSGASVIRMCVNIQTRSIYDKDRLGGPKGFNPYDRRHSRKIRRAPLSQKWGPREHQLLMPGLIRLTKRSQAELAELLDFRMPDLTDCELKPYVDPRTPDPWDDEFGLAVMRTVSAPPDDFVKDNAWRRVLGEEIEEEEEETGIEEKWRQKKKKLYSFPDQE
eukprot:443821_1